MPDNESLETFFNDRVSDEDGVKRVLRVTHPNNPIEGYHISDQEVGVTSYFGYLRVDGAWYIQKSVRADAEVNYTYKAGSYGYSWAGRAGGGYASFDTTF